MQQRATIPSILLGGWMCVAGAMAFAQPLSGPVTVITIIDVVPDYALAGNVQTSVALLKHLAEVTQSAPGLVSFKVLRDANRDNHFVIEGVWNDMHAFETYSGATSTRDFREAFQPGEAGPFDERVYVDMK